MNDNFSLVQKTKRQKQERNDASIIFKEYRNLFLYIDYICIDAKSATCIVAGVLTLGQPFLRRTLR